MPSFSERLGAGLGAASRSIQSTLIPVIQQLQENKRKQAEEAAAMDIRNAYLRIAEEQANRQQTEFTQEQLERERRQANPQLSRYETLRGAGVDVPYFAKTAEDVRFQESVGLSQQTPINRMQELFSKESEANTLSRQLQRLDIQKKEADIASTQARADLYKRQPSSKVTNQYAAGTQTIFFNSLIKAYKTKTLSKLIASGDPNYKNVGKIQGTTFEDALQGINVPEDVLTQIYQQVPPLSGMGNSAGNSPNTTGQSTTDEELDALVDDLLLQFLNK